MAYAKNVWYDDESGSTPITADKLNHIEQGVFDNAAALASVSSAPRLFVSSCVLAANGEYVRLWSRAEFISAFGRAFDTNKDFVAIMNGDGVTAGIRVYHPEVWNGDIWVYFGRAYTGSIRLNYLVALTP